MPDWRHHFSQRQCYYGYKLHAVCGICSAIHDFDKRTRPPFFQGRKLGIPRLHDARRQRLSVCRGATKSFLRQQESAWKYRIDWTKRIGGLLHGLTSASGNTLKPSSLSSMIISWWFATIPNNPAGSLPAWQAKLWLWLSYNM